MQLEWDAIRSIIEIVTVLVTVAISVKVALNGMQKDVAHLVDGQDNMAAEFKTMRAALDRAGAERARLDTRMTVVEHDIATIASTLDRMEKQ